MSERIRDFVRRALREQDPELRETEPAWTAAAFLLASMVVGPDPVEIAAEMEIDPITVGALAERARRSMIWSDGVVKGDGYADEENGGIAFWADVTVLTGDLIRHPDGTYQMSPEALARVKGMLAPMIALSTPSQAGESNAAD